MARPVIILPMNKNEKRRRNIIKALIDKPEQKFLVELKEYRYCSICDSISKHSKCPKDNTITKRIFRNNKYAYCKAMIKILLNHDLIKKDELHELELIKLCWKGKYL